MAVKETIAVAVVDRARNWRRFIELFVIAALLVGIENNHGAILSLPTIRARRGGETLSPWRHDLAGG
jgi:hypothetical protein